MIKKLIISAGGENKRMKNFLLQQFNGIPKHLLPIPGKRSIIEEIVKRAENYFQKIIISANEKNKKFFQKIFRNSKKVYVVIDKFLTGPLGPICRELLRTKKRTYGCAGDFYCEFDWKEFEEFHSNHSNPVSILVAPSVSVPDGAYFEIEKKTNKVISWKRRERTKEFDIINMGAYIIDPTSEVLNIISTIKYHKEDVFFDLFVPKGLIYAYNPNKIGFNINVPATYEKMCSFLKEKLCSDQRKIKKE
jgi:NDP-sugar pyrophosphorylase family protein